ncbi:hypothetical protein CA51_06290 [Rosistilla oblonga]|uniref:Uncharacterized protein n=1 Tax=Rosistilla oblonga TaxID=2527990 RepID=A0A518INQ9_9BACT|nr:hypothetical protein [Rosistilla oblonga]QDV10775.1 hypothetical protein CA51_06290 [Rosistilla oblonga]QDV54718.1 hypothetical protein Mal33_06750 [Rosistilla oblonga]
MNRSLLLLSLVLSLLAVSKSDAQFEGMKYRIPADANTLILINAEKAFGSPVSDRERWAARRKAAYDAGVSALPPDATEVILAGRSDLEYGKSVWELALMKLTGERNVATVATRFGGSIDNIAGRSAARLPDDHYVVQIRSDLMGAYTPANRQDVSRWLKSTDLDTGQKMSPYLQHAFAFAAEVGTPIVMAMDLSGLVSEAAVTRKLPELGSLKDSGLSPAAVSKLIGGVQGIMLGITLEDQTIGAVRVDFEASPEILAKVGKPLLIEILSSQGAMIDDIRQWTPSVKGNTFFLRGKLSASGTRRVMSVLELPRSLGEAVNDAASSGADSEESAARIASQQYFKSVSTLLDDLRDKPKTDHVKTFGQAAIWYDKYARKIDSLPLLNVDPALLKYGSDVSGMLRDAEMSMKGVGMRSSVRTGMNSPTSYGYSSYGGGYRAGRGYDGALYGPQGYSASVGAAQASVREEGRTDAVIRGQERTKGAASVQQIWQDIDSATAEIRQVMTGRYSAEF